MDNLSATGTSLSDEVFGYVPPDFLVEHGLVKGLDATYRDHTDLNVGYDFISDEDARMYACDNQPDNRRRHPGD